MPNEPKTETPKAPEPKPANFNETEPTTPLPLPKLTTPEESNDKVRQAIEDGDAQKRQERELKNQAKAAEKAQRVKETQIW